jgi:hypothetical protein
VFARCVRVAELPCRPVVGGEAVEARNDDLAPVDAALVVGEDLGDVVGGLVGVVTVGEERCVPGGGHGLVDSLDPPPLAVVEERSGDVDEREGIGRGARRG